MSTGIARRFTEASWIHQKAFEYVSVFYPTVEFAFEHVVQDYLKIFLLTDNSLDIVSFETPMTSPLNLSIESIPLKEINNVTISFEGCSIDPSDAVDAQYIERLSFNFSINFVNRESITNAQAGANALKRDALEFILRLKRTL